MILNAGGMLELSEAIRDYHDNTLFPHMVSKNLLFPYLSYSLIGYAFLESWSY